MEGNNNNNNNNLESAEQENFKKLLNFQICFANKAQELNSISKEDSLLGAKITIKKISREVAKNAMKKSFMIFYFANLFFICSRVSNIKNKII